MNNYDIQSLLLIGMFLVLPIFFIGSNQNAVNGKIVSIQPDTQITYNKIVILDSNGHTFSQDISCTSNFQFQVNQSVSVIDLKWYVFDTQQMLNGLPAGCVLLK